MPESSAPPPPPTSSGAKYALLGIILLAIAGGLLCWRSQSGGPPAGPGPSVVDAGAPFDAARYAELAESVIADVHGTEMSFVTKDFRSVRPGDRVRFAIRPEHVHVFDRVSGRSLLNDGL